MADTPEVHMGENSPEQVAYKLLLLIGNAEQKRLLGTTAADRDWILRTYAACLGVVKQPHRVSEWLSGNG